MTIETEVRNTFRIRGVDRHCPAYDEGYRFTPSRDFGL